MARMTCDGAWQAVCRQPLPAGLEASCREAAGVCPGSGPGFLDERQIGECRAFCGLPPALDAPLLAAAARISGNDALRTLGWTLYWLVFASPNGTAVGDWSAIEEALGDEAGLFTLLIALGMVPLTRAWHRQLGVPEAVTRDTCRQVSCFCGNHERGRGGRPGIYFRQLLWLRHYTRDNRYFRLGRFEYWGKPFSGGVVAYRRRDTNQVLALAEDGTRFDGDGFVDGIGGQFDEKNGWTATLVESDACVRGFPISPRGRAERRAVALDRNEWDRVLAAGDRILEMHIPAGGGMTPEACAASLRQAVAFFAQHFPDERPVAISTRSWIVNPQLEEILPADSNLVAFLRELYLYPVPSNGQDGLWFIFLQTPFDPSSAPRQTQMQRAILEFIEAGGVWHNGGMFILTVDVPQCGRQFYRKMGAAPGTP